jgi:hypothetical protein
MASAQKQRDEARIRRFTRRLAVGAVAATGVFGGLAATASHQSPPTSSDDSTSTQVDDTESTFESDDDEEGYSAPTPSYQAPVAQSGGS